MAQNRIVKNVSKAPNNNPTCRGTEESQGRIHASSQPSSRLRDQNVGELRLSALGLIVGSVMGPLTGQCALILP
jgi:hypothetical protein